MAMFEIIHEDKDVVDSVVATLREYADTIEESYNRRAGLHPKKWGGLTRAHRKLEERVKRINEEFNL